MQKFYYRLLGTAAALAVLINAASFFAGFDAHQLINVSFFKERAAAEICLLKHIIFESGIYLKKTNIDTMSGITEAAAKKYGVDEQLLAMLIDPQKEFTISLTGGMGLSGICPKYFKISGEKDPFSPEQNIFATAAVLKKFREEGAAPEKYPSKFLFCERKKRIETLYPSIFKKTEKLDATYSEMLDAKN